MICAKQSIYTSKRMYGEMPFTFVACVVITFKVIFVVRDVVVLSYEFSCAFTTKSCPLSI